MFKSFFHAVKKAAVFMLSGRVLTAFFVKLKKLTVLKLIKGMLLGAVIVAALFTLGLFALIHYPATQIPTRTPIDETVYLDQGWGTSPNAKQRELYYYTAQGTSLKGFEYNWFVHLEMPWGEERFAAAEHMEAYGFIVQEQASPANPDLLPIGFTQHFSALENTTLLDVSCAACHNGQINYTKDNVRYGIHIDGGQAMHAFTTMKVGHFVPTLVASMASTYLNPFKFNRFAEKVLGEQINSENKAKLKARFGSVLLRFIKQGYNDSSKHLYPIEEGFGRTDALARIGNTVFGDNLDESNYHLATGPVSYPPVWNIWKFDWVQYGASVKQPMARNMGEALGVGAHINFTDRYGQPLNKAQRFTSSVMPENIHAIESTLQTLAPPPWPEAILGHVDMDKAAQGKVLFNKHCVDCHGPFSANDWLKTIDTPLKNATQPLWIVKTLPIEDIGTDPNTAFNFVTNTFDLTKTGLTEQDIAQTVRPLWVKQLKRVVDVALHSDELSSFLSQAYPLPNQLELKTDWVAQNQAAFMQIWRTFSQWNNYHTHLNALNEQISVVAEQDDIITRDIKYALVMKQLSSIDANITDLSVKKLTVGEALNIVGIIIREKYYADNNFSVAKQACLDGFAALDLPQQPLAYKARPLAGIWATPPFLHNGAVPNIYQLLSPVDQRSTGFYVGNREYDPQHLGYVLATDKDQSHMGTWFDTQLSGNLNTGHEFRAGYVPWKAGNDPQYGVIGPELSPEERFAIIEYLKIHQDAPDEPAPTPSQCGNL